MEDFQVKASACGVFIHLKPLATPILLNELNMKNEIRLWGGLAVTPFQFKLFELSSLLLISIVCSKIL